MKFRSTIRNRILLLCLFFIFCSWSLSAFSAGPLPVKKTVEPPALFPAGDNFLFGYLNEQGQIVLSGFEQAGDFSEGLAPVAVNGAYGFIDPSGKPVIAPRFADAGPFSEGLARVKLQTLWGYVDKTGTLIIKPQFQEAFEFSQGLATVKVDDKFGVIDHKGSMVLPPRYEKLGSLSDGLIAAVQGGKWGYIDPAGNMKINPQFEQAGAFVNGLAPARSGGKWGFIDKSGKWIVPPKYDNAQSFSEGLAAVGMEKEDMLKDEASKKIVAMVVRVLWGYIDTTGKEAIPPTEFMNVSPFTAGRATAFKKDPFEWSGLGQFGYIDKTGTMVLTLPYRKNAGVFHNGLARVELGRRTGYIEASGKMVIPQNFTEALPFNEGLAAVSEDGQWKYINQAGEVVIRPRFYEIWGFRAGSARVLSVKDGWGLMDKSGKTVLQPRFNAIAWYTDKILAGRKSDENLWGLYDWSGKEVMAPQLLFVSGLGKDRAVVQKGDKYGILGADGQFTIPAEYDDCGWIFSEGLLPVSKGGKYGFIDADGKFIIEPQYDAAVGFTSEKLCAVKIGPKWGFINRANKLIIPAQYDLTVCFSEGRAAIKINDQWGFIDTTGKIVAKPKFREAGYFSNGLALVKVNEKWGYIDKIGKMTITPQYDQADPFNNGLARVRIGKHFAYIDLKGKSVWMAQPGLIAKQFAESLKQTSEGPAVSLDANGLRTLKANVVVDQYVRQRPEWRKLIETRLQAVSDYFEKNFKIRLAVISVLPWESPEFDERKNPDAHFMTLYDNLVFTVPPLDAEIVIGYTGQKGRGTQIGQSGFYGQHVLMLELKEDMETLIRECSIHEIFHLFGAFHVSDKQALMFRKKTSFDPRAGVEQWILDPDSRRQMDLMHTYNFLIGIDGLDNEKIKQAAKIFSEGHNAEEGDNGEDYRGSFTVAEGYYSRGRRLERRGDLAAAVQHYQKAAALTRDAPDYGYYGRLGDVLLKEGRFSEGYQALRKCLEIKPGEWYWHWFLANALEEQRERDAAFVQCRDGTTPALAAIYQHYVLNRAKPEEALAEFQQAALLAKDKAFYHYALAQALRTRGRNKEALAAFQRAVTLAPDNAYYKEWVEKVQKLVATESK